MTTFDQEVVAGRKRSRRRLRLRRATIGWAFALPFCCFALWKYQAKARPKAQSAPRRWGEVAAKMPLGKTLGKHPELP